MRALITGGYGFVGRHLAHHLVSCGDDVAVTYLPSSEDRPQISNSYAIPHPKTIQSLALDVSNREEVEQLITLTQPDVIYHLAAMSFVPEAENNPYRAFDINTIGTINLCEALLRHARDARLLYVSSSEVYGEPKVGSLPLNESAVLRPISAYGASKVAADRVAYKYAVRDGLNVIIARPFPHVGPGQSESFAVASFSKQVAQIKLGGKAAQIRVGNLEAKRDYCDVSDIVRGYREALLNGKRGEAYNLCSGSSNEIGEILKLLMTVGEVEAEIVEDPELLRPIDIPDIYGDYSKAQKDFGWKPRIELEATLHSIIAHWMESLSK